MKESEKRFVAIGNGFEQLLTGRDHTGKRMLLQKRAQFMLSSSAKVFEQEI